MRHFTLALLLTLSAGLSANAQRTSTSTRIHSFFNKLEATAPALGSLAIFKGNRIVYVVQSAELAVEIKGKAIRGGRKGAYGSASKQLANRGRLAAGC